MSKLLCTKEQRSWVFQATSEILNIDVWSVPMKNGQRILYLKNSNKNEQKMNKNITLKHYNTIMEQPRMTKYEYARVKGIRMQQLIDGMNLLLKQIKMIMKKKYFERT